MVNLHLQGLHLAPVHMWQDYTMLATAMHVNKTEATACMGLFYMYSFIMKRGHIYG